MLTTTLDLLAVVAFGVFAYLMWPPAVLLVAGAAALAISWKAQRR